MPVQHSGDLVFHFVEDGIPISETSRITIEKFNLVSTVLGLKEIIYAEPAGAGVKVHFRNECCSHQYQILSTNEMIQRNYENTWSHFKKLILSKLFPNA